MNRLARSAPGPRPSDPARPARRPRFRVRSISSTPLFVLPELSIAISRTISPSPLVPAPWARHLLIPPQTELIHHRAHHRIQARGTARLGGKGEMAVFSG